MQTKTNKQHPNAHEIKIKSSKLSTQIGQQEIAKEGAIKNLRQSPTQQGLILSLGFPCTVEGVVVPRLKRAVKFTMSVHFLKNVIRKSTSCPQGVVGSEWQSQIIAGSNGNSAMILGVSDSKFCTPCPS